MYVSMCDWALTHINRAAESKASISLGAEAIGIHWIQRSDEWSIHKVRIYIVHTHSDEPGDQSTGINGIISTSCMMRRMDTTHRSSPISTDACMDTNHHPFCLKMHTTQRTHRNWHQLMSRRRCDALLMEVMPSSSLRASSACCCGAG